MVYQGYEKIRHIGPGYSHSYHSYLCGHCNTETNGHVVSAYPENVGPIKWLLCTKCGNGSVLTNEGVLHPSSKFGSQIDGLPQIVSEAYDEARICYSIHAFTACELICRKILMNVAVDKGAKQNDTFEHYIDFLESKGYITQAMTGWVSLIRKHGGGATHEITSPSQDRSKSTLEFTIQLLRIIYEMEHKAKQYTPKSP